MPPGPGWVEEGRPPVLFGPPFEFAIFVTSKSELLVEIAKRLLRSAMFRSVILGLWRVTLPFGDNETKEEVQRLRVTLTYCFKIFLEFSRIDWNLRKHLEIRNEC